MKKYYFTLFIISLYSIISIKCTNQIETEKIAPSSSTEKTYPLEIRQFKLANQLEAVINSSTSTIIIAVPYNTILTNIVVEEIQTYQNTMVLYNGNPVVAGLSYDFTNPLTFTVTSTKEAKQRTWTIQVIPFKIDGISVAIEGFPWYPFDPVTKFFSLDLLTFQDPRATPIYFQIPTGSTITPRSGTPVDITKPVKYTLSFGNYSEEYTVELNHVIMLYDDTNTPYFAGWNFSTMSYVDPTTANSADVDLVGYVNKGEIFLSFGGYYPNSNSPVDHYKRFAYVGNDPAAQNLFYNGTKEEVMNAFNNAPKNSPTTELLEGYPKGDQIYIAADLSYGNKKYEYLLIRFTEDRTYTGALNYFSFYYRIIK